MPWQLKNSEVISRNSIGEKTITNNASTIIKDLEDLNSAFKDILSWKWDERYATTVGEFRLERADAIRTVLEQNFVAVWDGDIIKSASDIERATAEQFGGMKAEQLLYTSDPQLGAITFCAWWPWGDGQTISIRIGSSIFLKNKKDNLEMIDAFKARFKVQE